SQPWRAPVDPSRGEISRDSRRYHGRDRTPLAVRGGQVASRSRLKLPENLTAEFQRIFNLFEERTLQIDEVIENSGYSPSRVSEIVLELELQGYVRQLPGKKYTAEQ